MGIGKSGGGCTVLSTAGPNVDVSLGMALDDQYVYWSEEGARVAIARAPKAGGARQELVQSDHDIPFELAVNSTSVVWSEGFSTYRLRMAPKAGGTAIDLLASGSDELHRVVADDARVYFSRGAFFADANVESIGFSGSDVITYGTTAFGRGQSIVLAATSVYWVVAGGTEIHTAALTGTQQTVLALVRGVNNMTLMGGDLYVYEETNNTPIGIRRVTIPTGQISSVYEGNLAARFLVASGTTLYFGVGSALYSLTMGSQQPRQVLATRSTIGYVVADASGVYVAINHGTIGQAIIAKLE